MEQQSHDTAGPAGSGLPQLPSDLPPIEGVSDKQRAYASGVRDRFVRHINHALLYLTGHTCDGDTSARRALGMLMEEDRAWRIVALVEREILRAPDATTARYWIDHAGTKPEEVALRVLHNADQRIEDACAAID